MNTCMDFPNNWHAFLDDYSFKDSQEVYTNGSNLISTFRVEQLIEHYFLNSRPKARWILSSFQNEEDNANDNYQYECSNCGYGDIHAKSAHVSYCWHCGAEMEDNNNG